MKHSLIALSREGKILCVELGNPTVSAHQYISTCVCVFRMFSMENKVNHTKENAMYANTVGISHKF